MLIIRLQRTGRTKRPFYRLVVAEKTRHVTKKVIEIIGHYDPRSKVLVVKKERVEYWLKEQHVATSDTVKSILLKNNLIAQDTKSETKETVKSSGKSTKKVKSK